LEVGGSKSDVDRLFPARNDLAVFEGFPTQRKKARTIMRSRSGFCGLEKGAGRDQRVRAIWREMR
jgi:hypothetical protein